MGMIGVDKIGEIRRAYFEQGRTIKEIVRTLSVSRATVRKVIRGHGTEFKYDRGVQLTPKLGDWVEVLTEILEKEGTLPKRPKRLVLTRIHRMTRYFWQGVPRFRYRHQHLILDRARRSWRTQRVNRNRTLFGSILTAA